MRDLAESTQEEYLPENIFIGNPRPSFGLDHIAPVGNGSTICAHFAGVQATKKKGNESKLDQ